MATNPNMSAGNCFEPPYIYRPLDPRWSVSRPQVFSTGFCSGLFVQFGSIVGLFAAVLVRLIFSNCFSAYLGFVYLEDSKKVPVWLRCYVVSLAYGHPSPLLFSLIWAVIFSS